MMTLLRNKGARMDIQADDGLYPMHLAAANGNLNVIEGWNRSMDSFVMMIALGVSRPALRRKEASRTSPWKLKDYDGRVPAHWASINGHVEVLRELKADVDMEDSRGWTCLHMAALYQRHNLIHTLCTLSSDPNKKDINGYTPLVLACSRAHWKAAALLLANKVAVDIQDADGRAALDHALDKREDMSLEPEILSLLSNGSGTHAQSSQSASGNSNEPAELPPRVIVALAKFDGPDYWAETIYGIAKALGPLRLEAHIPLPGICGPSDPKILSTLRAEICGDITGSETAPSVGNGTMTPSVSSMT